MYLPVGVLAAAAMLHAMQGTEHDLTDSTAQDLTNFQLGPALLQGHGGMAALQIAEACRQPGN